MKLTFEQIKSVTVGAVKINAESDGIHFHKCTEKQEKAWAALNANTLGPRSLATTGIRLDFHTNSKSIRFSASSGNKFELYINGIHRKIFRMNDLRDAGEIPTADITDPLGMPLDEARITLYFPAHSMGVLEYVELDDGATVIPHKFDCNMLFIGDSITQGWDSTYDSLSYAQCVSRFFNANSVIHGVGGGYYHDTIFDSIDFKPDTVVVAFGTNDFSHYKTIEEFRYHCSAFLKSISEEYANVKNNIFVISPIWRADYLTKNAAMGSFADCRGVVIDTALKYGLNHIDGLELVPTCETLMADGFLHPNTAGFGQYALNLISKLTNR
jgi:lysophospholipase L1-like esterase